MLFIPIGDADKFIPVRPLKSHNHHPQSSRWRTCFCTSHMDEWEVTRCWLFVAVININYIRWINVAWTGYTQWNEVRIIDKASFLPLLLGHFHILLLNFQISGVFFVQWKFNLNFKQQVKIAIINNSKLQLKTSWYICFPYYLYENLVQNQIQFIWVKEKKGLHHKNQ